MLSVSLSLKVNLLSIKKLLWDHTNRSVKYVCIQLILNEFNDELNCTDVMDGNQLTWRWQMQKWIEK